MTPTEHAAAEMDAGAYLIPHHMLGGFLGALLSNDFMGAAGKADDDNQRALIGWAKFLYNHVPSGSYGSPGAFSKWIERGGLAGADANETEAA